MTCNAIKKCTHSCTSGNCKTVICTAETCYQSCTGGGCGLECHGQSCEQSCTKGNCQMKCPSDASKCEQRCTLNKDKCTTEVLVPTVTDAPTTAAPFVPDDCDRVEDGVCYQSCTNVGCTMTCNNSPYYHSCEQSCTGMLHVKRVKGRARLIRGNSN